MTMRSMSRPWGWALALSLGFLALGAARDGAAQERVRGERQECRCVDADGKAIERCTCIVMPDVGRIVARAMSAAGSRARLGVTLTRSADHDARGAQVASVLEGGPADEAGIRANDVITRINGRSLLEPLGRDRERDFDEDGNLPVQRLMALVRDIEPGQEVQVEYLRDGERRTATVKARELDAWTLVAPRAPGWDDARLRERMGQLEERLGEMRLRLPREGGEIRVWADSARGPLLFFRGHPGGGGAILPGIPPAPPRLWECPGDDAQTGFVFRTDRCPGGLQLVALNPGLASYFRTDAGVLVAAVHGASRLGVQAGDVIVRVDGRSASDPDRLRRILSSYGADEEVSLTVIRQGREVTTRGTVGR